MSQAQEKKSQMIHAILSQLEFKAKTEKKSFNRGDTFFMLAFRTDAELKKIAKLCGA